MLSATRFTSMKSRICFKICWKIFLALINSREERIGFTIMGGEISKHFKKDPRNKCLFFIAAVAAGLLFESMQFA